MKISDEISLSARNLLRRKGRTALTLVGVVIGTCMVVLMISLGIAQTKTNEEMLQSWGDLTQVQIYGYGMMQGSDGKPLYLDDAAIANIKQIPHVAAATPYAQGYNLEGTITAGRNDRYTMDISNLIGIDPTALEPMGFTLQSGSWPTNTPASEKATKLQVLVGSSTGYNFEDSRKSYNSPKRYRYEGQTDANGKELPPFVDIDKDKMTLTIKTGVLRDMIDRTLYAVSQDEKKPAHTGELFEIEPDKMTIVALDGYRLAIVERPVTAVKDIRIIVPSKTMPEVSHLLPNDDEEPVHICANRRYVVFMTAGYTIMSRLIEGEFLNYHNVIPAGSRTRVTIDTKEFIETIERASLIITERLKNPLRITFTEGKVVVRCQTNLGRVVDEFNAECEGDEVEIGFNNRYLLDALRNARTEKVRMEISGPLSPVKVLPVEGNDFLYLVLPVRFKND